ncbi:MAG: hypothetical protein JST40_04110 [Armatimonadetes bacterium]|nr:hypothetical protein [Armatimonadota bacterium]
MLFKYAVLCAFALVAGNGVAQAQSGIDPTPLIPLVGTGDGYTNFGANAGTNNARDVAFTANDAIGSKPFFKPVFGQPYAISAIVGSNRTYGGIALQNGAAPRVICRELVNGPSYLVRSWGTDGSTYVLLGQSPGDFDSANTFVDINDSGVACFPGLIGGSTQTSVFVGSSRPPTAIRTYNGAQLIRPQISNNNRVVWREPTNKIVMMDYPSQALYAGSTLITTTNNRPGITEDGLVGAFSGARTGNAPGVFLLYKDSNNVVQTLPVIGDTVIDGNIVTSIPDGFRVGVSHLSLYGGIDRVTVSFFGTVNTVTGLFRRDLVFDNWELASRTPLELVAQVGQSIQSYGAITGLTLYESHTAFGDLAPTLSTNVGTVLTQARKFTFKQGDSHWAQQRYCDTNNPNTVGAKGCRMTALAQLMYLYGITGPEGNIITPGDLNQYCQLPGNHDISIRNKGISFDPTLSALANAGGVGKGLTWVAGMKKQPANDTAMTTIIDGHLAAHRPVLLHVRGSGSATTGGHYVLAIAKRTERHWSTGQAVETYVIYDPADRMVGGKKQDLGSLNNSLYDNNVYGFEVYKPSAVSPNHVAPLISITIHSPLEAMITDSQGRRTGFDPVSGQVVNEIPDAAYSFGGGITNPDLESDLSPEYRTLVVPGPVAGTYGLTFTGTGSGTYDINVNNTSLSGSNNLLTVSGTTSSGQVTSTSLYFDGENGATSTVGPDNGKYVQGKINFGATYQGAATPVHLELLDANGNPIRAWDMATGAEGDYQIGKIGQGTYTLTAKGATWLTKARPITIGTGSLTGIDFQLVNGDCDGDNAVTVFDYLILSEAFDSQAGSINWNQAADLDGDKSVTVFDYLILSENFDAIGD